MSRTLSIWQRPILIWAAGLIFSLPGYAADTQLTRGALTRALEQAWRLNPEARAQRDIALGLTPEPGSLTIGSRSDRLNRNLGMQEYEVELATPLWLPGQKAAREAEADSRIDDATAKRAALRSELAGELRDAWWALAAARNANALAARRLETARALEADVRRRYKVGELSRIDANLAQTEVHAAGAELIEAKATLLQADQALRNLTGTVAPAEMVEEALASRHTPDATGAMSETHPLLAAAAAAARSARAKVTVADESRRAAPELALRLVRAFTGKRHIVKFAGHFHGWHEGLEIGVHPPYDAAPELALRVVRERGDFAEPYANTVGVRLKIPFSSGAQVLRETSAAQAEANQADAEMLRTQTRVQLETERTRRALASAEQQLVMAQERVGLSTENLRLSEKAFSLGETDLATLLRIRAAAFDADAFLDRQRVARAAAISRLNQALGVLP